MSNQLSIIYSPPALDYKLLEPEDYYINQFRNSLNVFLAYTRSRAPELGYKSSFANWNDCLKGLYLWVSGVLNKKLNFTDYLWTLYDNLRSEFDLNDLPVIEIPSIIPTNVWGPVFWKFLHYGSICTFLNYKNSKDSEILARFGALLINFDVLLLCGVCGNNYKEKNVYENFVKPMMKHKDSIITIFNLHNAVNTSGKTAQPAYYFQLKQFEDLYKIKQLSLSYLKKSPPKKIEKTKEIQ